MNADFIVVGAGIAGSGVAYELSRTAAVIVLESEAQPGFHSTGRSAALFSEIYGNEAVRALSRASREFLSAPPAGFTPHPLLKRRGSLYLANETERAAFDQLQAAPDVQRLTRPLTPTEALSLVPILKPEWTQRAMLEEGSHDVDVHALHQGYLRGMKERGAKLVCSSPVTSISRAGGLWTVVANGARFTAPVVIDAAGAWADEVAALAGVPRIGLEPRRRTALLVDPPAGVAVDAWPMVLDVADTFYFKPDAGKLLLSPADETPSPPCDVQPEDLDVAIAVDRVEQATTMTITRVRHQWAGLRSFVVDRSPVIGFDPQAEGFFWLAAQGGYGIQSAPGVSRFAAALALGAGVPDEAEFIGIEAAVSPARLRA
jgi:D-arginine dehydrogenase